VIEKLKNLLLLFAHTRLCCETLVLFVLPQLVPPQPYDWLPTTIPLPMPMTALATPTAFVLAITDAGVVEVPPLFEVGISQPTNTDWAKDGSIVNKTEDSKKADRSGNFPIITKPYPPTLILQGAVLLAIVTNPVPSRSLAIDVNL
jgi:hypothetical protein